MNRFNWAVVLFFCLLCYCTFLQSTNRVIEEIKSVSKTTVKIQDRMIEIWMFLMGKTAIPLRLRAHSLRKESRADREQKRKIKILSTPAEQCLLYALWRMEEIDIKRRMADIEKVGIATVSVQVKGAFFIFKHFYFPGIQQTNTANSHIPNYFPSHVSCFRKFFLAPGLGEWVKIVLL